MEREGYPEGYDKNEVYIKAENSGPKIEQLEEILKNKKKRLWVNVAEFFVGVVLLVFSWQYLQTHPAEKVSLLSGFDMIMSKVRSTFGIQNGVTKELNTMVKAYGNVLESAKKGECFTKAELIQLQQVYDNLGGLEGSKFSEQKVALSQYLYSISEKVKNECTK